MRTYLELFRHPGVVRVTASQVVARIPLGMLSIAVLLHVDALTHSLASAGLVVAAMSGGQAVMRPVTSRIAAAVGARRTILVAVAVNASAFVAMACSDPDLVMLTILGAAIGASVPPLMPIVRALYPRLVPPRSVAALFALDTTTQELIWIIGPVLATVLSTTVGTSAPLLVCAAVTVGGCTWFLTSPALASVPRVRGRRGFGRVLRAQSVLLSMTASFLLVASFMALEVAVLARYDHDGIIAGIAIAVSSAGSLIGGLAFGHRDLGVTGTVAALAVVTLGTALAIVAEHPVLLASALLLAGLGFAPALAALYLMVSRTVSPDSSAEAFGWLNTASLTGAAAGTALAGLFSDALGVHGAFGVSVCLAGLSAITPLLARAAGPVPGLSREHG